MEQDQKNQPVNDNSGLEERNLGAWLLLSYLTLGIVFFYWLYLVRKDLYKLQDQDRKSHIDFVLAIIFFPYTIYYVYKLARETERLSQSRNIMIIDDLALSCLLISLMPTGPFIAITLIQATLNKMSIAKKETL